MRRKQGKKGLGKIRVAQGNDHFFPSSLSPKTRRNLPLKGISERIFTQLFIWTFRDKTQQAGFINKDLTYLSQFVELGIGIHAAKPDFRKGLASSGTR